VNPLAFKEALMPARQREALAQFAEAARNEKRMDQPGLVADDKTTPIPTNSKAKDDAATKVLQEGATGEDHGSEPAIDRLPDRIFESRPSDIEDQLRQLPDAEREEDNAAHSTIDQVDQNKKR
jgi:hypothetical protein